MQDPPRLLHARSELAYTANPMQALRDEPEAVSADYQAVISYDSQRRAAVAARAEWDDVYARLCEDVAALEAASLASTMTNDVRTLRRAVDRLGDRLRRR